MAGDGRWRAWDVLLRTAGGAELRVGRIYLSAFRAMLSLARDAED